MTDRHLYWIALGTIPALVLIIGLPLLWKAVFG